MWRGSEKILAMALCLSLTLAGCARSEPSRSGGESDSEDRSTSVERTEETFPTAADYYRFLREEVLVGSEAGHYKVSAELASTEPLELKIEQGDFMETFSWDHRMTGTIGAVVEDFDQDGTLEMLTILADSVSVQDSKLADVLYPSKEYNADYRIFELRSHFYDVEDDSIARTDGSILTYLPMNGWGCIAVGIEKLEESYYLYTWTYSENLSTYGPRYSTIQKIPQGEYYQSAISACGLPEILANRGDGQGNFSDTTIYDRLKAIDETARNESNLDPNEESFQSAVDGGLLCFFNVAHPEWGGSKAVQTITDYTDLRHYLENDGADWKLFPIPQGGAREVTEGPYGMDSFISELEAVTGAEFISKSAEEKDGIHSETFYTKDNSVVIQWNVAQNRPEMVGVYSQGAEPASEWFVLKDAILSSSVFGWAAGDADFLKGEVKWDQYSAGVAVGDYICGIALVTGANFQLTRN